MTFLAVASSVAATPRGGLEARTEQGQLTQLQSWWQPGPEWEGRWWWREEGGGSAWLRAGALQAGPLIVYSGGEGWRSWTPSSVLSSGNWGVALDTDSWGGWAVQRPENLEAGAQAKAGIAPWSLAAGADRTWALDPSPTETPWKDRARFGLTFTSGGISSGAESTSILPARGPMGWKGKGRFSAIADPWSFEFKDAETAGWVEPDQESWSRSVQGGWNDWESGWKGCESDPMGRSDVEWERDGTGAGASWGPKAGVAGKASVRTDFEGLTLGAQTEVGWGRTGWTSEEGASAAGRFGRGRWMGSWLLESGSPDPTQTLTANWKEPSMEFEARWRVEGFRLGWMGPGSRFNLKMAWLF